MDDAPLIISGGSFAGTDDEGVGIAVESGNLTVTGGSAEGKYGIKYTNTSSGNMAVVKVKGYYIFRSVNGSNFSKIATVTKNSTIKYTDTKATTNGAKYEYKIVAFSDNGQSDYQIKYVTGKTTKTITIKKNSTIKYTITKLKKNKTYKVYIRAYKKVSGKTYYSLWSSAKSKKITK